MINFSCKWYTKKTSLLVVLFFLVTSLFAQTKRMSANGVTVPEWMQNSVILYSEQLSNGKRTIGQLLSIINEDTINTIGLKTKLRTVTIKDKQLSLRYQFSDKSNNVVSSLYIEFICTKVGTAGSCFITSIKFEDYVNFKNLSYSCPNPNTYPTDYGRCLGALQSYSQIFFVDEVILNKQKEKEAQILKAQENLLKDLQKRSSTTFFNDEYVDFGDIDYIEAFDGNSYFTRIYAIANQLSSQKGFSPCYYQTINGKNIYDISKWDVSKPVYIDDTRIGFIINGKSIYNLKLLKKASDKEKTDYDKLKTEIVKKYYETISLTGSINDSSNKLLFIIPLDNSYDGYTSFKLNDNSGKSLSISQTEFLSKLKEITKQDYEISSSELIRNATEEEKVDYDKEKSEVIKSYFQEIVKNGKIDDTAGTLSFSISLDDSYNGNGKFTLKDSFSKTWSISQTDFLSKLKEITNQDYKISSSKLIRNVTEEEKVNYDKEKSEVVKSYFKSIAKSGKIDNSSGTLAFCIPLDNSYNGNNKFVLKDSSSKTWNISKSEFLSILNSVTNQEYLISSFTLIREPTEIEKEIYKKESNSEAFRYGLLHTNLLYNLKGKWVPVIEFSESKGEISVKSFKIKNSIFEKNGLKTKDIIKKIVYIDDSGRETEVSYDLLQTLQAPGTLIFTVERGKGKKAQTLTIEIPVEWNQDELKLL